jgi:hypothetical protein
MPLRKRRGNTPEEPPAPDFVIGPFQERGLLLAEFPSNHPMFVVGALTLNLTSTYDRFDQGPLGGDRRDVEEEYRRAMAKQNELHRLQSEQRNGGKVPTGILAFNNDMPGPVTVELLLGYGYNYREFAGTKGQYANVIGNLVVTSQRKGIGAAIARELLKDSGMYWTRDDNRVLHVLHHIDPQPAGTPEVPVWADPEPYEVPLTGKYGPLRAQEERERVKDTAAVLREIGRAYPNMPDYTVVDGLPAQSA